MKLVQDAAMQEHKDRLRSAGQKAGQLVRHQNVVLTERVEQVGACLYISLTVLNHPSLTCQGPNLISHSPVHPSPMMPSFTDDVR